MKVRLLEIWWVRSLGRVVGVMCGKVLCVFFEDFVARSDVIVFVSVLALMLCVIVGVEVVAREIRASLKLRCYG